MQVLLRPRPAQALQALRAPSSSDSCSFSVGMAQIPSSSTGAFLGAITGPDRWDTLLWHPKWQKDARSTLILSNQSMRYNIMSFSCPYTVHSARQLFHAQASIAIIWTVRIVEIPSTWPRYSPRIDKSDRWMSLWQRRMPDATWRLSIFSTPTRPHAPTPCCLGAVAAKSTASVRTFPSYTTLRPSIQTWLTSGKWIKTPTEHTATRTCSKLREGEN